MIKTASHPPPPQGPPLRTVISVAFALIALLCLGYVCFDLLFPPQGRNYGHDRIYPLVASLLLNIVGIGVAIVGGVKVAGLLCNILGLVLTAILLFTT